MGPGPKEEGTAVVAVSSKDTLKRDPTHQKRFEKGARRNRRFPKPGNVASECS